MAIAEGGIDCRVHRRAHACELRWERSRSSCRATSTCCDDYGLDVHDHEHVPAGRARLRIAGRRLRGVRAIRSLHRQPDAQLDVGHSRTRCRAAPRQLWCLGSVRPRRPRGALGRVARARGFLRRRVRSGTNHNDTGTRASASSARTSRVEPGSADLLRATSARSRRVRRRLVSERGWRLRAQPGLCTERSVRSDGAVRRRHVFVLAAQVRNLLTPRRRGDLVVTLAE